MDKTEEKMDLETKFKEVFQSIKNDIRLSDGCY